jgi:cysteine desulfurase NifS
MTADAAYADIVLPATTMFEIESYMTYGSIFRWREKLIEPVGQARNDYLIMAELANRLGYGDLYPQTEEEVIRTALEGSDYTFEDVKKAGGWVKKDVPMMEYKKWEKGALRSDGKPGFETPTGKFEIWSTVLEDYGYEPLPKYTEPTEGPQASPDLARSFPLVFNSGARPHTDFRSQHHGIKGLLKDNPEPMIELNTIDATQRGIKSGDLVEVQTPRGSSPFRAFVTDQIVQGAVECNMGGGTPVGPKAWQEWNVNELTDLQNYDEISGFPVYKALLCDVIRMENGSPESKRKTLKGTNCKAQKPLFELKTSQKKYKRRIYLDNNATTEMPEEITVRMQPFMNIRYGNPSALHETGRNARESMDAARRSVAALINARPKRIIFTGCGSEADNMALKGVAFANNQSGKHIVTSKIEHPAILKTCQFLENIGFKITYLDVDSEGLINPRDLNSAIGKDTILVSIMMANNEVGSIQPIKELASIAHENNLLFHTDAVQAAGKIPIDVEDLDIDMLTISAHKFHGPKGIGALFVKKGVKLEPMIHGGKQESGLRAGTENVAGIVGMGHAAETARTTLKDMDNTKALRDYLENAVKKRFHAAVRNGHKTDRLPNTLNMTLPGLRGESLVIALDQYGISLSSGSACKSGSPEPTHVLLAMGRSEEEAHCSVRFSLSHLTTREEILTTVKMFDKVLEEMETTVRFLPCK